jgi:hypothetical protein
MIAADDSCCGKACARLCHAIGQVQCLDKYNALIEFVLLQELALQTNAVQAVQAAQVV